MNRIGEALPDQGRGVSACRRLQERYGDTWKGLPALVLTLAYTGLRWGEPAALRVGRVDLMRGRLVVAEAVSEVAVTGVGTPKSHQRRLCRSRAFCAISSLSS